MINFPINGTSSAQTKSSLLLHSLLVISAGTVLEEWSGTEILKQHTQQKSKVMMGKTLCPLKVSKRWPLYEGKTSDQFDHKPYPID